MRPASVIAVFRALTAAGYLLASSAGSAPARAPLPNTPPAPAAAPAASPAKPAKPAIELRGKISGEGGVAIAKAVVLVLPDGAAAARAKVVRAESAPDGAFVVGPLTGEAFRVRIQAKGYAPLTEGSIPGGATISLRLKKGFSISGSVADRASKKPIDGASVSGWDVDAEGWGDEARRTATAGKDGRFMIADLAGGKATIEAKAPGHAAARTARLIGAAKPGTPPPAAIELLLDPAGTLSGRVTDTANTPIAGADVTVYWRDASGERTKNAKTDADGHYGFPAAADLRIRRMTVVAKGFPSQERLGDAPSDDIVDFILEHGGAIAGQLRSGDASALPSFHLTARRERSDDDPPASGRAGAARSADKEFSDPSGSFRLEDLDPGTYTVEIQAKGFATLKKTGIEVRAEQVADLGSLRLDSSSTFRGRVVSGSDQAPVPAATVRLSLVDAAAASGSSLPSTNLWNVTSSPDGTFSQPGLLKGTYDLTAEHTSFAPVQMRVTFDPGADPPEVVVTMFHGGTIVGTVYDAQMQPVAGVRILASQGVQSDARVADTGSDGHYMIEGLTPGTYQVTRQPRDGSPPSGGANVKSAAVQEAQTTTVDFDEGARIQMSGIVRKGDQPLANTSIYLFAVDNSVPLRAKKAMTDESGSYKVGLDQGGRYQASVRIDAEGVPGGQNLVMLTVPDQPEVHQDIVFAVNAIVGHVTNPDGGDIKGAIILALQDAAPGSNLRQSTTTTAADGTFRLDAVEPGTYRVTARATGFAPAEQYPVAVNDEQPEPHVELTMERGWLMRGRVVDPNGRAVTDATIVVAAPGNAESGFLPAHTDSTGAFRITSPLDGPISVAAISPRFAPAVKTDIDPPGNNDPPEIMLRVTAGGTLRIRVVHRGGGPVAGAAAVVRPMPLFPGADLVMDRNRPKPTDADGASAVTNLYPGTYVVALVGRSDASPAQANVGEGAESEAVVEVP